MAGLRSDPYIVFNVIMSMVVLVVVQFGGMTSGCSSGCPPSPCPTGVRYQVGSIWSIPPFPTYYSNWSLSHFFRTGDFLSFNFETGYNNVIQVSRHEEYESCTACNPISVINIGPAVVPLAEKGVFYFISNFSNYCDLGLKVSVTVHDCYDGLQPTPSPSPSPVPAPSSSSSAPSPRTRDGSINHPVSSPAPSPYGYPPEAGAPSENSKASAPLSSSKTLFCWVTGLSFVAFVVLG